MKAILALLLLGLAGCDQPMAALPEDLPESVVYEPPDLYRCWWLQVEQASGIDGDLSEWEWRRVVRGEWYHAGYDRWLFGLVLLRPPVILMADGFVDNEGAVKHEMLHAILRGDPDHTHPLFRDYNPGFEEVRCGRGTY